MRIAVTISWEEIKTAIRAWAREHGLPEEMEISYAVYQQPGMSNYVMKATAECDAEHFTAGPYR